MKSLEKTANFLVDIFLQITEAKKCMANWYKGDN